MGGRADVVVNALRRLLWLPTSAPAAGEAFVRAWLLLCSWVAPVTPPNGEEQGGGGGGDNDSIDGAMEPDPALQLDDAIDNAGEDAGAGEWTFGILDPAG